MLVDVTGADDPEGTWLATDRDEVTRAYSDVLRPSFPDGELCGLDELLEDWGDGVYEVLCTGPGSAPTGVIVGERVPDAPVVLVEWLATRPGQRGAGVGGRLVSSAVRRWAASGVELVLAEVERPGQPVGELQYGDPQARIRFYDRLGARAVPVPYFQPFVSVPGGLILIVIHPAGVRRVDAGLVRAYLAHLFGGQPRSRRRARLFRACAGQTLSLIPLAPGGETERSR